MKHFVRTRGQRGISTLNFRRQHLIQILQEPDVWAVRTANSIFVLIVRRRVPTGFPEQLGCLLDEIIQEPICAPAAFASETVVQIRQFNLAGAIEHVKQGKKIANEIRIAGSFKAQFEAQLCHLCSWLLSANRIQRFR
jgi:hypothetical protein